MEPIAYIALGYTLLFCLYVAIERYKKHRVKQQEQGIPGRLVANIYDYFMVTSESSELYCWYRVRKFIQTYHQNSPHYFAMMRICDDKIADCRKCSRSSTIITSDNQIQVREIGGKL